VSIDTDNFKTGDDLNKVHSSQTDAKGYDLNTTAKVQYNLGTAFLTIGEFEQAIVNFTNALKINPKSSDALGNRAVAYTAIGDEEKSEIDKIEAIKMGAPPDGINSILDYVRDKRNNSNPFKN